MLARLHEAKGGNYIWVVNQSRIALKLIVRPNAGPGFRAAEDLCGGRAVTVGEKSVTVTVGARDAAVVGLR